MNDDKPANLTPVDPQLFQRFRELVQSGDSAQALENLANSLLDQKHFHELFEVRKIQLREQLGLPIRSTESTSELPPAQKATYEQGLIDACEEIGTLLLKDNRLREAWVYLQAVDDQSKVQKLIMSIQIDDENADDMIGLAINEGIAPVEGFQWILDRMGTCNAITTYDSFFIMFTPEIRTAAAEKLVLHLRDELKTNLTNQIHQQHPEQSIAGSIAETIDQLPWVFGGGMRHIDESHLASVMRIGRIVKNAQTIEAAIDLAAYGQAMPSDYADTGETPFEDLYVDSHLFFEALGGKNIVDAKRVFKERAEACKIDEETSAAVEWYLYLLGQLGDKPLALQETLRLLPGGMSQMQIAPSVFDLCASGDDWATVQDFLQVNSRLLEFSVAVLEARG